MPKMVLRPTLFQRMFLLHRASIFHEMLQARTRFMGLQVNTCTPNKHSNTTNDGLNGASPSNLLAADKTGIPNETAPTKTQHAPIATRKDNSHMSVEQHHKMHRKTSNSTPAPFEILLQLHQQPRASFAPTSTSKSSIGHVRPQAATH